MYSPPVLQPVCMNHATTDYSHTRKNNFNQENRIKSSPRGRNSDSFLACSALIASMVAWDARGGAGQELIDKVQSARKGRGGTENQRGDKSPKKLIQLELIIYSTVNSRKQYISGTKMIDDIPLA